ncbi:hypothetical protein [Nocardia sp. NPDC049707]|uniref:hypothetical protein n=1 Tax=Nocardia sp. NPDC049707 TaxID=3154735 RepID=UPI00343CFE9C
MKFRLSLWPPTLEIETPEPVQISTADVAATVFSAMSQGEREMSICVHCLHDHAEDDTDGE